MWPRRSESCCAVTGRYLVSGLCPAPRWLLLPPSPRLVTGPPTQLLVSGHVSRPERRAHADRKRKVWHDQALWHQAVNGWPTWSWGNAWGWRSPPSAGAWLRHWGRAVPWQWGEGVAPRSLVLLRRLGEAWMLFSTHTFFLVSVFMVSSCSASDQVIVPLSSLVLSPRLATSICLNLN